MSVMFEAVGGHADQIFVGNPTDDGRGTLQKVTTAWEIFYYVPMSFPTEAREALLPSVVPPEHHDHYLSFVKAVQGLRQFAPDLFSIRFPDGWQPKTTALKEALANAGNDDKFRGAWIETRNVAFASLWGPLFAELYAGALSLEGFDDLYDKPCWGIGLVDETSGMASPSVMDIKVGYIRHSPFTAEAKVERMRMKESGTLATKVGLRVCGFRRTVYGEEKSEVSKETRGKEAGYIFESATELSLGLKGFFSTKGAVLETVNEGKLVLVDRTHINDPVAVKRCRAVSAAMSSLVDFFDGSEEGQYLLTNMAFVSASLLLIYDSADSEGRVVARLIDFARSGPRRLNFSEEKVGFLQGLKNIQQYTEC